MREEVAPGLPADWLNGWLAAIGVTVLVPEVKLSWSDDAVPLARFLSNESGGIAELVADALLEVDELSHLAIARTHPKATREMRQSVDIETYRERARVTRQGNGMSRHGDFSLAASVTDLVWGLDESKLPHSPFDPPAEGKETFYNSLLRCRRLMGSTRGEICSAVSASVCGAARREKGRGLGFDARRLAPGIHPLDVSPKRVNPGVEVLCFFGLGLFPVRGGSRRNPGRECPARGWLDKSSRRSAFAWPTWSTPLDSWGIDALLDRFYSLLRGIEHWERHAGRRMRLWEMTHVYGSVPFRGTGDQQTSAYASEPLPWP